MKIKSTKNRAVTGKPRYFSREDVLQIPDMAVSLWILAWGVLEEKNALDLERFILKPDALLNSSNNSETNLNCELLALIKRRTSSAKRRWDNWGPLLLIWMGSEFLWLTALLMVIESFSIHKMKRYGESGSPWRWPWVGLNCGNLLPFHKTEKVGEDTQCMIIFMVMSGKLKSWRVLWRKSQLTLSKAFYKSSLKAT